MNNIEQTNPGQTGESVSELNHTDKLTGIFTEPAVTFEKTAMFPPRVIDWILPVILLFLVIDITNILVLSNEEIFFQEKQKQLRKTEMVFNDMVQKKQMTREQAGQQLEQARQQWEMARTPFAYFFQTVLIFILGSVIFFISVLIYFLFARITFKGTGTFQSALVAGGLPAYITILQVIIAAILSLAFGTLIRDTSAAAFMGMDKSTFTGYLLAKVDPLSIWAYSVIGIGLAKMFKSKPSLKYFLVVFGLWIIGSLLFWLLGKAVPFLSFFTEM
jgi:hypothetical protein